MKTTPLSCDLHDYLEIACVYGYRIKLTLKDGKPVEGVAKNIITSEKREFLIVENEQTHKIELNHLSKMKVLNPNAKFSEVVF
ncbi:MAG: Rho-binding antiterminator [Methyloglobulus sp.]|nr:transcriptional regulator [Methyloglobulus sp.]